MKRIADLRHGLNTIPGACIDFLPDATHRGQEPGVYTTQIWRGEDANNQDSLAGVSNHDEENSDLEDAVQDFDPVIEIGADVDETFPALDGKEGEHIRRSFERYGMDALGWYSSFHVTGVQWGIHVPSSGIAYLICEALSDLPVSFVTKTHLAFHAILNHELFHFATDFAVGQAELVHQEPWWVPAMRAVKASQPGYCVLEEQLANAYMLKAFRTMKPGLRVPGKQKALREFTRMQPEGYRDGDRVRPQDWERRLAELAREYGKHSTKGGAHPSLWDSSFGYDWAAQFPIQPRIDWRYCPIHFVHDGSRLGIPPDWLTFISRITKITELEKFCAMLEVLARPIQKAWDRTKLKLREGITTGADFKKWPKGGPDVFSVRVNDRVRAHLQYRRSEGDWLALEIGGHKELGHG